MGNNWASMQWFRDGGELDTSPSKKKNKKFLRKSKKGDNDELIMGRWETASTKSSNRIKTESGTSSSNWGEKVTLKSFKVTKIIGEGAYGKVYLVKRIDTGRLVSSIGLII